MRPKQDGKMSGGDGDSDRLRSEGEREHKQDRRLGRSDDEHSSGELGDEREQPRRGAGAAGRCVGHDQGALAQGRKAQMRHIQWRAGYESAQPLAVHSSRLNPCFTMPKRAPCYPLLRPPASKHPRINYSPERARLYRRRLHLCRA
jgi:hypothetical protein